MYEISPNELYTNYLEKYNTEHLYVHQFGTDVNNAILSINLTHFVPQYNRETEIYSFFLRLAGEDDSRHIDLYTDYQNYVLYDKKQSAFYLYKAVKHLSLYKNTINRYAYRHLIHSILLPGKEVHSMAPGLLYMNLSKIKDVHIVRDGENFDNTYVGYQFKPVYNPSHNPLYVHRNAHDNSGALDMTIVFINKDVDVDDDDDDDDNTRHNIILGAYNYTAIPYHIIQLVHHIVAGGDVKDFQCNPFPVDHYMNRVEPLNKTRLFAIKLMQLYHPRVKDEKEAIWKRRIVDKAKSVIEMIKKAHRTIPDVEEHVVETQCEITLEGMIKDFKTVY